MDCHKKFYNTFLNNKTIQVLANDICFDKKKIQMKSPFVQCKLYM